MTTNEPTGGMTGPVKWFCAVVLGCVGMLGVAQGLMVDQPAQDSDREQKSVVIPAGAQSDGQQAVAPEQGTPEQADDAVAVGIRKLIDINTASLAELELLPRIGPVMAQRIIDDRLANGPFRSDAELDRVRGIGPKTLEKLSPLIRFD